MNSAWAKTTSQPIRRAITFVIWSPPAFRVRRTIHCTHGDRNRQAVARADPRSRRPVGREGWARRALDAPIGAGARRLADERLPLLPGQGRAAGCARGRRLRRRWGAARARELANEDRAPDRRDQRGARYEPSR